jgi:hypothetical protein
MIYRLENTDTVKNLFDGWEETPVYSCLQKTMGSVYVTDLQTPVSAMALLGCFAFLAGEPDRELVLSKPAGFTVLVPQDERWNACIESCFPEARKTVRYAIRKDTQFDPVYLQRIVEQLPEGYELKPIDGTIYDLCLLDPLTECFVSVFPGKEQYLQHGKGFVVMRDGRIVSGASSYSRYREGIEIEVDTVEDERRKGFASAACAALILQCLDEGLYPSWDAHDMVSVRLAQKLGYELDHAYTVYEASDRKDEV